MENRRYTSSICHSQGSYKVNKLCQQQARFKKIVRQLFFLSGQSKDLKGKIRQWFGVMHLNKFTQTNHFYKQIFRIN